MNEHVPENASPESRPGTCDLHRRAGKTELRLFILVFADELVPDEWIRISEAIAIKIARGSRGIPGNRGSIAFRRGGRGIPGNRGSIARGGGMSLRLGERRGSQERGERQACDKFFTGVGKLLAIVRDPACTPPS